MTGWTARGAPKRFPALFAELESGRITLSAALLLKRVLSPENQLELFAALRGVSTERARELLAERFPSPDVPSGIRKLPERRNPASQPANATPPAATLPAQATASAAAPLRPFVLCYRVQFTADASLKRKLEQASDLLRHAQPDGDLGAIVSRALDLLLDEAMRRRFGKRKQRVAAQVATASAAPPAATPAPVAAAS